MNVKQVIEMVSEEQKKEDKERKKKYNYHLRNVIRKLDKTEDAIDEMIEFCSHGEPEFHGSKAMKFFFSNLSSLNRNGKHFLYEIQDEIEFRKNR